MKKVNLILILLFSLTCFACQNTKVDMSDIEKSKNEDLYLDTSNLRFLGINEGTEQTKKYLDALNQFKDLIEKNNSLAVVKYNKSKNRYDVVRLLFLQNSESSGAIIDEYKHKNFDIYTKSELFKTEKLKLLKLNFKYNDGNITEYISTYIQLDNPEKKILTINKFGIINEKIRDFDTILLFIPQNYCID